MSSHQEMEVVIRNLISVKYSTTIKWERSECTSLLLFWHNHKTLESASRDAEKTVDFALNEEYVGADDEEHNKWLQLYNKKKPLTNEIHLYISYFQDTRQ